MPGRAHQPDNGANSLAVFPPHDCCTSDRNRLWHECHNLFLGQDQLHRRFLHPCNAARSDGYRPAQDDPESPRRPQDGYLLCGRFLAELLLPEVFSR